MAQQVRALYDYTNCVRSPVLDYCLAAQPHITTNEHDQSADFPLCQAELRHP
jgi:hypothetical protein